MNSVRPTKKQRELLTYIGEFIAEHGYSPTYREIMAGLQYTSVATVALHVNNLIKRGHLRKRESSARSLELAEPLDNPATTSPSPEQWLDGKIEQLFHKANTIPTDELEGVVRTLRTLDLTTLAEKYEQRLEQVKTDSL